MKRDEAGFTLIELMISIVLFSFAIAGVLAVAVSMTQSFREQRFAIRTMDSARGSLDFIADAIRQASPGVSSGTVQDVATCTNGTITLTNSTSGPDDLTVVYASGAVVTATRGAYDNSSTTALTVSDASQLVVGDSLLITDGTKGHIVVTSAVNTTTGALTLVAPATCTPTYSQPLGSLVVRARRARFYVGTFDSQANVLLMDPDANGPLAAEPLAENVEDFQVAVGIDVDGNGGIESTEWEYSSGIGALTGTARAIRLTIVAREGSIQAGATSMSTRPAAEDHAAASSADGYRRRVLTSTIEIRNLGGSP